MIPGVRQSRADARRDARYQQRHLFARGAALRAAVARRPPYRFETQCRSTMATLVCDQDTETPQARVTGPPRTSIPGHRGPQRGTSVDRLARCSTATSTHIVFMAMRKARRAAYASAACCGRMSSHLTRLPVLAHRGGRRYRIGKSCGGTGSNGGPRNGADRAGRRLSVA